MAYRQNQKGGWDVYFNNEEFGITFWLPQGYKPEDYNIIFESNDVLNAPLRRCHNVNIEVLNTPENTNGRLSFDKYAGAHFVDNLMICVKDGFSLEFNENTLLGSSVPHSPDGFRRVYMDYFDLSHNYNVDVVFKDPASTAPVKELEEKDIPSNIFEGFIHENKNINFTVLANRGLLALMNNTYAPMRENNYQRLDVISNADHFGFAFNDITIKTTKEFIDKKRPAELNFNAEAAIWSETKLDVLGVNTITLKSPSSSKPAILKGSKVEGFFSDADLEFMGKKAKITGSSKVSLNLFGYSSLKANGNIAIEATKENTSLYKAKIESKNGPLNIFDSNLDSVKAEFNMKKGIVASIKESRIKASTIRAHQSNIVSSNFSNVMMNNSKFGQGAKITLAEGLEVDLHNYHRTKYEIDNLELKENSTLKIGGQDAFVFWPENTNYQLPEVKAFSMNITNTVVSGSNNLKGFPLSELNNSLLENTNLYCFFPEVKINNTILKNSVSLKYISEVNNSEIDNSHITAKEPMAISDQFLQKEKIEDYEKFLNKNVEYLVNDIGHVTNEISPL